MEAIERGDVEVIIIDEFACEVCRKTFKKEKQLDNHLASKKHKDALKVFKASLVLSPEDEAEI